MTAKINKESRERMQTNAEPIRHAEEVENNPDPKIDEDFKGFPHAPAKEEIIRPENPADHKTAGTVRGEEIRETDGQSADGSAGFSEEKESLTKEIKKSQDENRH